MAWQHMQSGNWVSEWTFEKLVFVHVCELDKIYWMKKLKIFIIANFTYFLNTVID